MLLNVNKFVIFLYLFHIIVCTVFVSRHFLWYLTVKERTIDGHGKCRKWRMSEGAEELLVLL